MTTPNDLEVRIIEKHQTCYYWETKILMKCFVVSSNATHSLQAGLTALAVMRFRQGAGDAFSTTYDHEGGVTQPTPSPYSTYAGGETGDPYQQPPFGEEKRGPPPPGDFSAPTY